MIGEKFSAYREQDVGLAFAQAIPYRLRQSYQSAHSRAVFSRARSALPKCRRTHFFEHSTRNASHSHQAQQFQNNPRFEVRCTASLPQSSDPCALACLVIGNSFEKVSQFTTLPCKAEIRRTTAMLTQLSNLLFSSSIKALDELIYPSRHDGAFVRCRELIAAVLFSKSHQVPPNALIEMLTSHLFQENIPNVVSLSSRQLQIVQPFIRHIYAVDTYFTKRDRSCHNRMQAVGRRSILFTSSQEYRYTDIERAVHRGAPDSLMCLQTYLKNLAVSMENSEDGVPDVPSRCSIPRVWEDVLVYLILVLRNHRKSCNV